MHNLTLSFLGLVNRTDLVAMLTNLLIPMIREDINEMWEVGGEEFFVFELLV